MPDAIAILTARDTCEGLLVRKTNPQNKWNNWPLTMTSNENLIVHISFQLSSSNILHTFSHLSSNNHLNHLHGMYHLQNEDVAGIKSKYKSTRSCDLQGRIQGAGQEGT